MRNTWVEISEESFSHNLSILYSILSKKTNLSIVLKANAYGHDISVISKLAKKHKVSNIVVYGIEEALCVRSFYPEANILIILGQVNQSIDLSVLSHPNYSVVSCYEDEIIWLNKLKPKPKIHFKVNTGMGRLGFKVLESKEIIQRLFKKGIVIDGLMTHFAKSDEPHDIVHTEKQIKEFLEIGNFIKELNPNVVLHCCASAGTLHFPHVHLDMVRVGIAIYGMFPSESSKVFFKDKFKLKPVLSWKTKIIHIQTLEKGDTVSYGAVFTADKRMRIAIIPVGYYEGLSRSLSKIGEMLVCGKRARILGRVCMNLTILDITHIENVKLNEVVTIIGKDGLEEVSADEIAFKSKTINYEVVTRINPLISRVIV